MVKKITIFYAILMSSLYLICLSNNANQELVGVIVNSVILSLTSFMLLFLYKLPDITGFDRDTLPITFSLSYKLLPFMFTVPLIIISTILFIRIVITKDFKLSYIYLPTIFYCYNSNKIFKANKKNE